MPESSSRFFVYAWSLLLVIIPLFSIYGRSLQRIARAYTDNFTLSLIIGTALFVLLGLLCYWGFRRRGRVILWHLLWLLPLFLVLPSYFPIVEERVHFILFGAFGFLAINAFGPVTGVLVCLAMSGLDELLQWSLPDRVGDWRDVGMNMAASFVGAFLARAGAGKREKSEMDKSEQG